MVGQIRAGGGCVWGWRNCVKYHKRGWSRKEGRGNKNVIKGVVPFLAGSRGGCLKKWGWNPLMNYGYIPEITATVFELLAVGNNKLAQRKEPHYCKSWSKLDLARKTKSTEYSVVFESEYHININKFLKMGKCVR